VNGHVGDRLSPYLDDELDARERAAVTRHLEACAECARLLEELAAVDRLVAAEAVPAPAGYFETFGARVSARLRDAPADTRPRLFEPAWALAAAAVLVVAVLAPSLLRDERLSAPESARLPAAPAPAAAAPPATSSPALAEGRTEAVDLVGGLQERDAGRRDQAAGRERAEPAAASAVEPAAPPPAPGRQKAESVPKAAPEPVAADEKVTAESLAPPPSEEPEAKRGNERRLVSRDRDATLEREGGAAQTAGASRFADAPASSVVAAAPPELQKAGPSPAFRALMDRRAETIAEARGLREAWRAFARGAAGAEADEARVRVIEAGADAHRLSGDAADLELARRDAAAYLKREDAAQAERVRALLAALR